MNAKFNTSYIQIYMLQNFIGAISKILACNTRVLIIKKFTTLLTKKLIA